MDRDRQTASRSKASRGQSTGSQSTGSRSAGARSAREPAGSTRGQAPRTQPRRQWIGYAAIGGGALLLGYALLADSGDEAEIRKLLEDLAEAVSSPEPITNVAFRASYLRDRFEETLAPNVRIDVPEVGRLPSDHRALALAAARVQVGLGAFLVNLDDVSITVGDDSSGSSPRSATARGTAILTGSGSGGRRETREVLFTLVEQSGSWSISAVQVSEEGEMLDS